MAGTYAKYSSGGGGGGGGGGVESINGDTTADQIITGGSGISVSTASGTTTITSSGGSGANTALSNLVTTSINESLVPSSNNTLSIGSGTDAWQYGYFASSAGINVNGSGAQAWLDTSWNNGGRLILVGNSGGGWSIYNNNSIIKFNFGGTDMFQFEQSTLAGATGPLANNSFTTSDFYNYGRWVPEYDEDRTRTHTSDTIGDQDMAWLILPPDNDGTGTIASYALTLPANPADGQVVMISAGCPVTSFTLLVNTATTNQILLYTPPVSLLQGDCIQLMWNQNGLSGAGNPTYWFHIGGNK